MNYSMIVEKLRYFLMLLGLSMFAPFGCRSETVPPYSEATEIQFRANYLKELKDPNGVLGFIKAVALKDDKAVFTFGSRVENEAALENWGPESLKLQKQSDNVVILSGAQDATLDGKAAIAGMSLSIKSAHVIKQKSTTIRISPEREGRIVVQALDSQSSPLQELHTLSWYPPASQYRVAAEWIPLPAGHPLTMQRTNGGGDIQAKAPGYVEFTNYEHPVRLYAQIVPSKGLSIVFRDLTSGSETYQSGRFLEVAFSSSAFDPAHKFDPSKRTKMALDFNQATNPPCAYNPHTMCPVAPPENRLSFAIPAGEKRYHQ